ncbi:MAG: tripartite tricarboxylate transporter permease [Chloroflexi bacterium]|nr:tripartite tricarboxylate transporter permease [Chloroflexota bacterium]
MTLLAYMLGGVVIGLIFGVIPGIGGMLAITLFLPFLFKVPADYALVFMVAITAAAMTGGSITAVLLNIPGTGVNIATQIDGFPMTQKGQAGRALGAVLTSSAMGGLLAALLALGMIPLVLPMVMSILSADMVFVILLGLSCIGILTVGSPLKGIISGGLGLMISLVGYQAISGVPRFTFGNPYLYDGIPLIPLILGLFALPEIIDLAVKGGTIAKVEVVIKGKQVLEGVKDVFRHWVLWLRSTVIGYIIGVIPGIGASTAVFVAYGQAKQTSKHPEKFGTGIVEGVIAPESSNNAVQAGALLTTLALGIPGSAEHAIYLGAFLILGLIPGPPMMREHLDLTLTMMFLVIIANVVGALICLFTARYMSKVAYVPSRILVPLVTVMVLVGAFAQGQMFSDVIVTLIFGAVGLLMRKFEFNLPALLVGYILGTLFEKYLFIALAASGPLFFMRPLSLSLIFIIIALFTTRPIMRLLRHRLERGGKRA